MTIDEALEVFLLPTQGLSLARVLHGRLLDSLLKSVEATDKRTRAKHDARIDAFLQGCRSLADWRQMALCFEEAFPKERRELHFIEAARLLRMNLLDRAHRLRLPAVTNRGVGPNAAIPTRGQLLRTVRATSLRKATAENSIGHPRLLQTIRQHGWARADVEQALGRRYQPHQLDSVQRYVRDLAKNGAFESVT